MSPLLSSRLYAFFIAAGVDTSASGQVAPSTGRNSGSVPWLASKRARICTGVIVHPALGSWQVTHERPLVPIGLKKGLSAVKGPSGW